MKYIVLGVAVVIACLALYLSLRDSPATANETAMDSPDQLAQPRSPVSPYMKLQDMEGNEVQMDSSKLVFVNVWATWCGPCNVEMPSIQSLYDRYKDHPDMSFYVVSDENPATVANFLAKKQYQLPFYVYSGEYPEVLNGNAIPRTYILRNGKVLAEQIGAINWNNPQVFKFIDEQLVM